MNIPHSHDQNLDQIAYWNGPAGRRWADRQAAQDVLLKPVADLVVDRAAFRPGERVIDVGCGSGATTVAFARKVAPSGRVLGVDVSEPMLERARHAAPRICRSNSFGPMLPSIRSNRRTSTCWLRASA